MISKSAFPGMDPYLEGAIWPNVHHNLASVIQELLAPKIAPKYVVTVDTYTIEDTSPESEVGITYPDVAILQQHRLEEPAAPYGAALTMTEPDVYLTTKFTVRIPVIEIKNVEKKRLITVIEILSPVNKRKPGYQVYHEKRDNLHESGVHVLELDLLRRGNRHVWNIGQPDPHYVFSLWRAGKSKVAVWTNFVQQPLPVLPVPLESPDPDVPLPLKQALDMIYQRGLYHLSIDYSKSPPPPAFSEADEKWMRELVKG